MTAALGGPAAAALAVGLFLLLSWLLAWLGRETRDDDDDDVEDGGWPD